MRNQQPYLTVNSVKQPLIYCGGSTLNNAKAFSKQYFEYSWKSKPFNLTAISNTSTYPNLHSTAACWANLDIGSTLTTQTSINFRTEIMCSTTGMFIHPFKLFPFGFQLLYFLLQLLYIIHRFVYVLGDWTFSL